MSSDNEYDAEILNFLKDFHKLTLCPYGEWTEVGGSRVLFDRRYRPICRIRLDGHVEIMPTDEFVHFDKENGERWFYKGFAFKRDPKVRRALIGIVKRYDLIRELSRRWEIVRHGGHLPRWDR